MDSLHDLLSRLDTNSAQTLPKKGSLHAEYKRCGKSSCRCDAGRLHGPYWYRYYREGGRLRKEYVRPERVEQVRAGIQQRRREQVERRVAKWQLTWLLRHLKTLDLW